MNRQNRKPKGKTINPTFFVFCEGKTEEQYINYLKARYRLPINIDAKIAGNRITAKYIKNYMQGKVIHPKDKTYLMYDLDVPEMLGKLQSIKHTTIACSNPCFEFWYLLHYQEHESEITADNCFKKLLSHHNNYKKGMLDNQLKNTLKDKLLKAINRAKKLTRHNNPSSEIFLLINDLEDVNLNKDR